MHIQATLGSRILFIKSYAVHGSCIFSQTHFVVLGDKDVEIVLKDINNSYCYESIKEKT